MRTKIHKYIFLTFLLPFIISGSTQAGAKMIYPIKTMSKLECRFEKFSDLSSNCKQALPILNTKDYEKYATLDDGFNDYTRIYTVLWGASYNYGWDVGNGGHTGVDIATAEGTPVYSIYDGTVVVAKNIIARGNVVSVEHKIDGKTVVSSYAHLSKIDVSEGDKVSTGDKVGEVGTTGNSTGNHLHFQIDLKSKFYPYYYDYNECPYSYNDITEKGVCFDVLAKHSIDPLLFLETQGAVLGTLNLKSQTVDSKKIVVSVPGDSDTSGETATDLSSAFDMSIFDRTVYVGYSSADIKKVQKIFKDLGIYKGAFSGDYNDVLSSVIDYQLKTGVIASKDDAGTGYFGPKTRAQVKKDYEKFLLAGVTVSSDEEVVVSRFNSVVTPKIDKSKVLSRQEIEQKENDDFLRNYSIDFSFDTIGNGITVGDAKTIHLKITDKKGRAFKGNLPNNMTFDYDQNVISAFPTKLYYFSDGKRDIKITALAVGDSGFSIKLGSKVLKTYQYKVIDSDTKIYPERGSIEIATKPILGDVNTGIIKFKDTSGKDMVKLRFNGKYKLTASDTMEFCIKKGSIQDLQKIYKKSCADGKFTSETEFTYEDTVGGILVFDYRVASENAKIELTGASSGRSMALKSVKAVAPKDLTVKYDYYGEVMDMIRVGVVNGINKGYFLQNREITEADAVNWIGNALSYIKENTSDTSIAKKVDTNLAKLKKEKVSSFNSISRQGFLEKVYEYLVFDTPSYTTIQYKDLDSKQNTMANAVFDKDSTWKEQFGSTNFRPEKKLTRGEAAFFLSELIDKTRDVLVTVK